ncbi:hypothetical protein PMKS-003790 [Pichia membranifaciens]|uniref:Uncharacterized protein n=1 Tax=Pichia membranifaciens TaxID=4926 RepID=A0A1Q2YL59_9ASCO|nr:hypothetical protein PMKS-003790 [Pichia membranifaciens]
MRLPGKPAEQEIKLEKEGSEDSYSDDDSYDAGRGGEGRRKRKLKYSDLYPDKPQCDTSTNQYFIGTMSTIDGIKTHTFPEVVKQIAKFKNEHPKKFRERNRRSAISFSIGILDDVVPDIEGTETTNEEDERRKQQLQLQESNEDGVNKDDGENGAAATADPSNGNGADNNGAKCGLLMEKTGFEGEVRRGDRSASDCDQERRHKKEREEGPEAEARGGRGQEGQERQEAGEKSEATETGAIAEEEGERRGEGPAAVLEAV